MTPLGKAAPKKQIVCHTFPRLNFHFPHSLSFFLSFSFLLFSFFLFFLLPSLSFIFYFVFFPRIDKGESIKRKESTFISIAALQLQYTTVQSRRREEEEEEKDEDEDIECRMWKKEERNASGSNCFKLDINTK